MRTFVFILSSISLMASLFAAPPRPNIILIMADDVGYSDIGCYGGEIRTPNLDALARDGVRFTQFYNTARCCPTRASLLTGLYAHQAGIGHMVDDWSAKVGRRLRRRSEQTRRHHRRGAETGRLRRPTWPANGM